MPFGHEKLTVDGCGVGFADLVLIICEANSLTFHFQLSIFNINRLWRCQISRCETGDFLL